VGPRPGLAELGQSPNPDIVNRLTLLGHIVNLLTLFGCIVSQLTL
jgi:hypothetical protein